jgi:hypothetical protein
MTDRCSQKDALNSKFNLESKFENKMEPFHLKNKDGVDFRYFWKCRHFENILFELGPVDYSRLSIFILCNTILGNLVNGLRESTCIPTTECPNEKKCSSFSLGDLYTIFCTIFIFKHTLNPSFS